ncbi:MAG: ribose 5-phosphate isomerase B [Eubacteriales bacterium]|nr:ribose 5-phosphate isomerase B [Eubacteriales bacterium]
MLALASDHAGYPLKEEIKKYLNEQGIAYEDFGTHSLDSVDYPVYAQKCAEAVASKQYEKGLLFCGTGIGISIAANKVRGIRCCVCTEPFSAKMSREHNDANMLALGARVVGVDLAKEIIHIWLTTPYSQGERHSKRICQIHQIEE